jgi:hypothetical protein
MLNQGRLAIIIIVLAAVLLAGTSVSWAKKKCPKWVAVSTAPGVEYCPNLRRDLFRHKKHVYYYSQENWYMGPGAYGPWQAVTTIPQEFYLIEARYFKTPPGWAKGKKTGWRGQPLPPGQMKKLLL